MSHPNNPLDDEIEDELDECPESRLDDNFHCGCYLYDGKDCCFCGKEGDDSVDGNSSNETKKDK